MIRIRIEENISGPTLLEMLDKIGNTGPITVHWRNTPEEICQLAHYRDRAVTLVVKDKATMVRTASEVEVRLQFEETAGVLAMQALNSDQGWRTLAANLGSEPTRALLVSMVRCSLRQGAPARRARTALYECLFHGVDPADFYLLQALCRTEKRKPNGST